VSNVRPRIGVGLLVGLTLSALLLWMTTAPAQALTVEECQAEIAELRDATAAARTFKSEKDRTGLLGKLDSASIKLTQDKTQDALTNLTSFRDKVSTLAAQGKLGQAEADALIAGANEAIACVEGLQVQAPAAA
jgi:hypothetical protein